MTNSPQQPLATAQPNIYIDVEVAGQRATLTIDAARALATELTRAIQALGPPPGDDQAAPQANPEKKAPSRKRKPRARASAKK